MSTVRQGQWRGSPPCDLGRCPRGLTLGILGMGSIGRKLRAKVTALGMITQYHNRKALSEKLSGGAKWVTLDELLATSDILSLNLPLNVYNPPIHS